MTETRHIGKYEILEEIGRGGFATVYKARDTDLERVIALKVLHAYWANEQGFALRFRNEARAAANLRHPNIVTVHEAGEADGQLYIAMEYLPGRTLRDLLEAEGELSLDRALPILEQIADAMDYAHAQGVVHRDIKPANIIVETTARGPRVTLMDFGLVKALESSTALTSQGTLLGSPEYMAPEQADPDRVAEIGPATDRYALGIVAYQMLAGRVPFPGNTPGTLNAHLNLDVPDPRRFVANLLPDVTAILLTILAKAPADRFSTAMAFVDRLAEVEKTAMTQQEPEPVEVSVGALQDQEEIPVLREHLEEKEAPKPRRALLTRRLPAWVWSAGLVGMLVLAGVLLATVVIPRLRERASAPSTSVIQAGDVWKRAVDEMLMVYVPAGKFEMGTDGGREHEQPVHTVVQDGFWIDRTEVTNAQYARCVASGACDVSGFVNDVDFNAADQPVVGVDWRNASAYCMWAGGRLPTEAEWEYAARGAEGRLFPWGTDFDGTRLNFCDVNCAQARADKTVDDGFAQTAPVASYAEGKSWCGAFDMAGNVMEWVADWYGTYPSGAQLNPIGPAIGTEKVLRGGSWLSNETNVRAAYRGTGLTTLSFNGVGFRCVVVRQDQ